MDSAVASEGAARAEVANHVEASYRALRSEVQRFVSHRVRDEALAEDLVQDVLLRMHTRASELRDVSKMAAWARSIALHAIVDHSRRRRETPGVDEARVEAEIPDDEPLDELVASWLPSMLALLPEEHAAAVRAADLEGKSMREIADGAGISVSGAKSRVQRGRKMLEQQLRACCELDVDRRGHVRDVRRKSGSCACET